MNRTSFLLLPLLLFIGGALRAQTETVIAPSNRSAVSLEKNMLFYANNRFSVTQSGSVTLNLNMLFDGHQYPSHSTQDIDPQDPYVLLIEDLPNAHVQQGGWVGWTARHRQPTRFKIEVYNIYNGANQWATIADIQNYTGGHYIVKTPHASIGKIRLTVYETADPSNNRLGISEVFFLHPEAIRAYDSLMVQYDASGNVGIGTTNPQAKLAVNGNILATEVKVKTDITVPDYVFEPDYELTSLSDLEAYVQEHRHLPEVPSAQDIERDGLDLAEMNLLLLKKVEELTLHIIELNKKLERKDMEKTVQD